MKIDLKLALRSWMQYIERITEKANNTVQSHRNYGDLETCPEVKYARHEYAIKHNK